MRLLGSGEIPSIASITQVIVGFRQGTPRNLAKTSELCGRNRLNPSAMLHAAEADESRI